MPRKNRRTRSKSVRRSNRRSVRRNNRRSLRKSNRRKTLRRTNRRKGLRRTNRRRTVRRNVDEKYGGALWKATTRAQGRDYNARLKKEQADRRDEENNLRQRARELKMPGVDQARIKEVKSFLSKADNFNKAREDAESREKKRQTEQDELDELRKIADRAGIDDFQNKSAKQLRKDIKEAQEKQTPSSSDSEVQSEEDYNKIMDNLVQLREDIRKLNEKCVSYSGLGDSEYESDRYSSMTTTTTSDSSELDPGVLADSDSDSRMTSSDNEDIIVRDNTSTDGSNTSENPVTQPNSAEQLTSTDGSTGEEAQAAAETGEGSSALSSRDNPVEAPTDEGDIPPAPVPAA